MVALFHVSQRQECDCRDSPAVTVLEKNVTAGLSPVTALAVLFATSTLSSRASLLAGASRDLVFFASHSESSIFSRKCNLIALSGENTAKPRHIFKS